VKKLRGPADYRNYVLTWPAKVLRPPARVVINGEAHDVQTGLRQLARNPAASPVRLEWGAAGDTGTCRSVVSVRKEPEGGIALLGTDWAVLLTGKPCVITAEEAKRVWETGDELAKALRREGVKVEYDAGMVVYSGGERVETVATCDTTGGWESRDDDWARDNPLAAALVRAHAALWPLYSVASATY
jgi:hypothetical protein